jgi:DNA polymerase III epsilon subunit-like protein
MDAYIKEFLAYMSKADCIIGHNLSYDMSMLMGEAKRLGVNFDFRRLKTFCTMKHTANVEGLHIGGKYPKLAELYRFLFNEDFDNAHDAMADIQATKRCFLELYNTNKIYIF